MNTVKLLSFLCLTVLSNLAIGQKDSSVKSDLKARPIYSTLSDLESLNDGLKTFDTSLNNEHQINPYRKENAGFQDLGLPGTPSQALSLSSIKKVGFDLGFNTMNPWIYEQWSGNNKLLIAQSPYTQIKYAQGEKELIFLELLHTQNINSRWNIGLDYRRLKSNNYLFNLSGVEEEKVRIPSIYNLNLFTSFRSKFDKYHVLGSIIYNKYVVNETGGLQNPLAFDTTSGKRRLFENPLVGATNSYSSPILAINQYFRFGKLSYKTRFLDTNRLDTFGITFKPSGYFYHKFLSSQSKYVYDHLGADTPYYETPYINGINDSMMLRTLTNQFGLVLKNNYHQFSNLLKMGMDWDNYSVFNSYLGKEFYHNLSLNAHLESNVKVDSLLLQIKGTGYYFLSGYNSGDRLFSADLKFKVKDKFVILTQFYHQKHQADYFQNRGFTSPIKWNQDLNPTTRNGFNGNIDVLAFKLRTGILITDYKNYNLYFFDQAPQGFDFNYFNLFLSHTLSYKKVSWQNKLTYQKVNEVYHLPKFIFSGGIFYQNNFFKNNMLARIGIDYYWYSSYYGDLYNPYLRQFVWQNQVKVGNYPYIDIYVSAQVQTMNLFFKFEHINQGISGNRYYSSPLYPAVPRFFRFGLNWRLFN